MSPTPPILVVGAIVARADGRILIAQRPVGRKHAGQWEFPGGKVEPGEDPRAALRRECREEMGCEVAVGAVYETIFHRYDWGSVLLLFYCAKVIGGEPASLEQNALAWVTPAEMAGYDLLEADRPLPAMFARRFPHFEEGLTPDACSEQTT